VSRIKIFLRVPEEDTVPKIKVFINYFFSYKCTGYIWKTLKKTTNLIKPIEYLLPVPV
jgi:hypothetical protein